MKKKFRLVFALLILGLFVGSALLYRIGRISRTVARAVTPDGIEMRLVQECEFREFPWLITKFYYRKPGGVWKEMLYYHEDTPWFFCSVSLDTNSKVAVFSREKSRGPLRFEWDAERTTLKAGSRSWIIEPGAKPSDWSP
jgi:hypothetical protein